MATTVPDVTTRFGALVTGTVRDAVTLRPLRRPFSVRTDRTELGVRTTRPALYAVMGDPERAFPRLQQQPYQLTVTASAAAYRPDTVTVPLPKQSSLPVGGHDLRLMPLPVRIQGRVVKSLKSPDPVADAAVALSDAAGLAVVALRTPLHFDMPAGATVRAVTVSAAAGATTLNRQARAGTRVLALTAVGAIGPGTQLCLDWSRRTEFVEVTASGPGAGEVTVAQTLCRTYAPLGPLVQPVTLAAAPGPADSLVRARPAGESLLELHAALSAEVVEIAAPGGPVDRAAVGAVSGPDGYFALDGLAGLEAVDLAATAPAAPASGPGQRVVLAEAATTDVALRTS